MKKIYITHGYTANPTRNWFPWLQNELAKLGIASECLAMPDPHHPTPQDWLAHHQKALKLDENTIFVGHSLGCIALLNYLAVTQQTVNTAIFVSGFYEKLPTLPELDPFADFYSNQTACLPRKSYVISALDDEIVPHLFSESFAQYLQADYIRLNEGGHFIDRNGVTELPILLMLLKQILAE
ncbi:RBBP9/YdeN family alpha/beta hydrolase [Actinobacillus vicugnae]|uniref:RBBP9/YdeN family alpha/beta hydrolase n=1 Tax=Actinobacillus vicugnae TaxID=2573093 RepID=UPI0012429AED|nr:alpha/beta hydrolase [Actinobacillus vicugnae]